MQTNRRAFSRVIVTAVFFGMAMSASVAAADEVDDYIRAEMQTRKIPGLAVVVLRGDQVVKQAVYGVASVEWNVPVTPDTTFTLASMSKEFTGVALLRLVEQKKIALDDRLIKYLPELPASWGEITIRHALSHTSGLPDAVTDDLNIISVAENWDEILKKLSIAPVAKPGVQSKYNQTGYILLGKLIEKVTGQPFETHIAEQFLKPHRMRTAVYGDSWDVIPGRAELYTAVEPTLDRTKLADKNGRPLMLGNIHRLGQKPAPGWTRTAVGLNASINDLTAWESDLMGGRVISQASLAEMTTPYALSDGKKGQFGLVFMAGDYGGQKVFTSGGGAAVWCLRFWDQQLTVLVLSNLMGSSPETFAFGIARKFMPAPKK